MPFEKELMWRDFLLDKRKLETGEGKGGEETSLLGQEQQKRKEKQGSGGDRETSREAEKDR